MGFHILLLRTAIGNSWSDWGNQKEKAKILIPIETSFNIPKKFPSCSGVIKECPNWETILMLHCLAKLEQVAWACVIRQSVDGIAFFSLSHLQLLNLDKRSQTFWKNCKYWKNQQKVIRPPGFPIKEAYKKITPWMFGSICDDVTVVLQCSGGICNSVTVWMFVSICYGGAAFPTRNWQFVSIFTPLDCYLALSSHRMRIKKTIFLPPGGNNPS